MPLSAPPRPHRQRRPLPGAGSLLALGTGPGRVRGEQAWPDRAARVAGIQLDYRKE
jgi:hypothetical protein